MTKKLDIVMGVVYILVWVLCVYLYSGGRSR